MEQLISISTWEIKEKEAIGSGQARGKISVPHIRNNHEVIRKDGGADKQFESLATLSQATFHPTAAEQNGDAPFN
ncbi:MAG: hypothetical protein H6Q05_3638 [Acidobacteria bacterium]|nr:hypothetical protein [Acidobacteriota bacterium]